MLTPKNVPGLPMRMFQFYLGGKETGWKQLRTSGSRSLTPREFGGSSMATVLVTRRRSAQSLSLLRAMSTPLLDDGMVYRTSSWKEKLVDEMIKVRDLPEPED